MRTHPAHAADEDAYDYRVPGDVGALVTVWLLAAHVAGIDIGALFSVDRSAECVRVLDQLVELVLTHGMCSRLTGDAGDQGDEVLCAEIKLLTMIHVQAHIQNAPSPRDGFESWEGRAEWSMRELEMRVDVPPLVALVAIARFLNDVVLAHPHRPRRGFTGEEVERLAGLDHLDAEEAA